MGSTRRRRLAALRIHLGHRPADCRQLSAFAAFLTALHVRSYDSLSEDGEERCYQEYCFLRRLVRPT